MVLYHFNRYPLGLVSAYLCCYHYTEEYVVALAYYVAYTEAMVDNLLKKYEVHNKFAYLNISKSHLIDDNINYQLNYSFLSPLRAIPTPLLLKFIFTHRVLIDKSLGRSN